MKRHPNEYILIGDKEKKHEHSLNGYKYLMRLCPGVKIPEGFIQVVSLNGKPVYRENGRLDYKFMGLKRYRYIGD